jgi:hypothetical protein
VAHLTDFTVRGLPLEELGADNLYVRYPDGTEEPVTGIMIPPGWTILEVLENWQANNPECRILVTGPPAAP